MSGYTKGNWAIVRTCITHSWPVRRWACEVQNNLRENIATAWGETEEEAQANAEIIKSCPDMFEFIKKITEWSRQVSELPFLPKGVRDAAFCLYTEGFDLVKKIEGV